MSLASLPADVVWNLTKYVLSSYEGPFRPGDEEHGRVLDLLRVLSVDKAARSLYAADPRFKALVFCTLHHESIMSFDDRTENGSDGWSDAGFERRMVRDDRSIRAAARAERAALIASVGGVDNLDYFWARQDKTRQQRDRERRAANFDRRPRFSGMFFF